MREPTLEDIAGLPTINGWRRDQIGDQGLEQPDDTPASKKHDTSSENGSGVQNRTPVRIRTPEKPTGPNGPVETKPQPAPFAFQWEPVTSAVFASADYRPNWHIKNALVERQPCIAGGPQKSLKTTICGIDLGVSLAAGVDWLGTFAIPVRRRVGIISGESGPFTLQETAHRVCRAKGLNLEDLGDYLQWQFRLPQLAVNEQLEAMRAGLEKDGIEVAVIDPLYLSLLAGTELAASNLYDIGPLLLRVAQACLSVGTTPILLHHTTKPSARKFEPLGLDDLAFSGVAEFARQWILLSRREAYEGGTGRHALWMVIGGSVGHGGHYAVDVDEGQLAEDFTGRTWELTVMPAGEARKADKDAKEQAKRDRDTCDETGLLAALNRLAPSGDAVAKGRVRDLAGLSKDRMNAAFERLIDAKRVKRMTVKVATFNGAERDTEAIQRVKDETA